MASLTTETKQALLHSILAGKHDLEDLCSAHGVTLEQLARWGSQQQTLSRLQALRHLADVRTQLIISRYRAHAAAKLIELTGGGESVETVRKACVDLLRFNVTDGGEGGKAEERVGGRGRAIDTERVRGFLAELGRAEEATGAASGRG